MTKANTAVKWKIRYFTTNPSTWGSNTRVRVAFLQLNNTQSSAKGDASHSVEAPVHCDVRSTFQFRKHLGRPGPSHNAWCHVCLSRRDDFFDEIAADLPGMQETRNGWRRVRWLLFGTNFAPVTALKMRSSAVHPTFHGMIAQKLPLPSASGARGWRGELGNSEAVLKCPHGTQMGEKWNQASVFKVN